MTAKRFKYWAKGWLEILGITLGISLLIVILQLGGSVDFSLDKDVVRMILMVQLGVFPYYMFAVAAFVTMMIGIGYFQIYFSTLVSMNATRKEVVLGILGTVSATIISVVFLAMLVWKIVPSEISAGRSELLILFAGIQFFTAGIGLVIGYIVVKWGKLGSIILTLVCVVIGGFTGAFVASGIMGDFVELVKVLLMRFNLWWTLVIGLAVYSLTGVFLIINTRKMEVRV